MARFAVHNVLQLDAATEPQLRKTFTVIKI